MGSRCSHAKTVTRKQNPSGLQRGSDNADNHVQNRSENVENPTVLVNKNGDHTRAASTCLQVSKGTERIQQSSKESFKRLLSGNPAQDSQSGSISKMVKNSACTIKKKEDRPRLSASQKNLKGKAKIQQFDKDQPKLPLAGRAGQGRDSHSQRENNLQNSGHLFKKNEDHTNTGPSTSQKALIKGKEKITRQSVKKKQQAEKVTPKPGPKNHTNKPSKKGNPTSTSPPRFHIFWDGFEESEEEALEQTQRCCLCDIDLAYGPIEEEAEDDYEHEEYEYQVFARLPEVAVLACGHAFHEQCLLSATPEEFSRDPLCFICASLC
ncbi:hypothetical protein WN943_002927 [Citrus x changshan-huyou]